MRESSAEHNGFVIEFRTAGKQALDVHSFLSDRATNGSTIQQDIRDLLNETAQTIADRIEKERALQYAEERVALNMQKHYMFKKQL